jgi:hypothetical protein
MPAANVATYFDFESAYENATATYLANVSGNPFTQILTPRKLQSSEPFVVTPRCFVKMAMGPIGGQEATVANFTQSLYTHRRASLTIDVATARNDTAQNHGLLRGWARFAMQDIAQAFNSNSVPYYQTLAVVEEGAHQGIDPDNDEIITSFTFGIEFALITSQLPASIP